MPPDAADKTSKLFSNRNPASLDGYASHRRELMKIAALYARVSTTKQQLNENIASQIAALKDYATRHDYQISPQEIYQDDGYSGATLDRPALDRLRDAVAQGRVEAVIILSPDRLARQFAYQYIVVEEFERAGCKIVFINHQFGSSPAERMLQDMTGVFAEYERALITERCRGGRLHKARNGQVVISVAPYRLLISHDRSTAPASCLSMMWKPKSFVRSFNG
jgi:site-specific DNA recombinase